MQRIFTNERPHWKQQADEFCFKFHTLYGESYWDESAYYRFTLKQIEQDLEEPTEEIGQMCLQVIDQVIRDESLLKKFQIPEIFWDYLQNTWKDKEPSLYSRIDLAYNGKDPAKFYENNADTPTSVYETGFWQWLWLQNKQALGEIDDQADQFNSLQEKLIDQFVKLHKQHTNDILHFACCKDSEEDRGTVQYLQDCAEQAGINCQFVYIEDIGRAEDDSLTNLDNQVINWLFKLYPWEFMFREEYGHLLNKSQINFIEPCWKSLLSNKALLPLLWKMFPKHPNLLPAYFEDDTDCNSLKHYVKKPLFSREGSNISLFKDKKNLINVGGPYGAEGFVYQEFHPLPCFDNNYALTGSWLVDNQAAGISIREDSTLITQDTSRFLPHLIYD